MTLISLKRTHTLYNCCSRHPSVKWAQSSDKVYVTIELPDAKDVKLKLEPEGKMAFSAVKNAHPYEFDIELLDKINVEVYYLLWLEPY